LGSCLKASFNPSKAKPKLFGSDLFLLIFLKVYFCEKNSSIW
jgi:hypothetical protein